MNKNTVQSLRKAGHKVEVVYHRFVGKKLYPMYQIRSGGAQDGVNAKGGKVTVRLTPKGVPHDFMGVSVCDKADPFVKSQGLNRALGRAIQNWEKWNKEVPF